MVHQPRFPGLRAEYEADGRAEHYSDGRWSGTVHARRTDRREQRIVADWLDGCGVLDRVLDLPCGTGRFAAVLAARSRLVFAADAAAAMLCKSGAPLRAQASAHALPYRAASFDLVLCSRLIHHLADAGERRAVLAEFARVSTRWLIVSHFDRCSVQAWRSRLRRRSDGRHALAIAEFRREAAASGWLERDRAWIARGISEQTWVLLERRDPAQG